MKKDIFGILMAVGGIALVIILIFSLNGKPVVAPGKNMNTGSGSVKDLDTSYTHEVVIDMANMNTSPNTNSMTNPSAGLQIEDIKIGSGKEVKSRDIISIHYSGTLLDGTKFDSSYDRGQPFETQIGVGQVIKGWDEGVVGMKVGGKRKLIIPPELGYGARGAGDKIPPNSTLVFEVELMGIK